MLKEGDNIDWTMTRHILQSTKMIKAFDTMLAVCEMLFAIKFERYHICSPDSQIVSKVIDEIMNLNLHAETQYTILKRFSKKTQRLFSRKWIYDTNLLPDSFWRGAVWESVCEHIKKPSYI